MVLHRGPPTFPHIDITDLISLHKTWTLGVRQPWVSVLTRPFKTVTLNIWSDFLWIWGYSYIKWDMFLIPKWYLIRKPLNMIFVPSPLHLPSLHLPTFFPPPRCFSLTLASSFTDTVYSRKRERDSKSSCILNLKLKASTNVSAKKAVTYLKQGDTRRKEEECGVSFWGEGEVWDFSCFTGMRPRLSVREGVRLKLLWFSWKLSFDFDLE